jgi:hypothetical protein
METITKLVTRKINGKTAQVEATYRVDLDFVPDDINDICEEFIQAYCVAQGDEAWLYEQYTTKIDCKIRDKDDKKKIIKVEKREQPFINIRKNFAIKYFPTCIKGKPEKTLTIRAKFIMAHAKKK